MALSPRQVEQKLRDDKADDLAKLEASIDRGLVAGRRTFGIGWMPVPLREDFADRFRVVGWDVEIVSDWRDGDFLRFTQRKPQQPIVSLDD